MSAPAQAPLILTEKERRQISRLMSYWKELAEGRLMPEENDIDPDALVDLWSQCFLIQVFDITQRRDYNFTYLGEDIMDAYNNGTIEGGDGILISPQASKLAHSYHIVLNTCAPVLAEGQFRALSGKVIRYRQCLLPLGRGEKVEAIFGGMGFKPY